MNYSKPFLNNLLATTIISGAIGVATPAMAQNNANPPPASNPAPVALPGSPEDEAIVVTGSIVRNPAAATASPVTSLSPEDIQRRGITTVADAIQMLPANNQGTAPPSWSSFGFATGASAPSLRGLNDAYTLTLFNGMRSAPYPLGDDGYRNFVDINTIPSSMVERIDVLQDGASATYGSDAIAGVVNVIVRRQIQGVHLNASSGISQRGDSGDRFVSLSAGFGDLGTQGFNVYVNGEYQYIEGLKLSARPGLFGTADQSSVCSPGSTTNCLTNGIRNGIQADGSYNGFQSTVVPFVRPYSTDPVTGAPVASLGGYQLLNPAAGCMGRQVTLTPAQRGGTITPATVCQQDLVQEYRLYNSPTERRGANIRGTVRLGEHAEAYAMFNYYNVRTDNSGGPFSYTGQTAAGGNQVTVSSIYLPAYICPAGVGQVVGGRAYASGCTAANGTLNPNNPFAASGQSARLVALSPNPSATLADTQTFRFSAGIDGSFSGFNYNLAATHSEVVLDRTNTGAIYLQGLLDVIAKGGYNFVNPLANTADANRTVFPVSFNRSTSRLTEVQASVNRDVLALPGGSLNIAIAGQYRREAITNPSSNPPNNINPNARYYGINAVGVVGARDVWSASYEVSVPLFDQLRLKAEGSYDHYSTGQSRFSPKFEAQFQPIEQITFRGTYSRGFRIPSFSESFALPTTGYVNGSINCASPSYAAFCAAHANNPSYYSGGYSYGLTSAGNANLQPERSEGFTAGVVVRPTRRFALTADIWQVRLSNVIVPTSVTTDIINQYYNNNGAINVPGIAVAPGVADPNNPGALPLLGNVIGSYQNADSYLARGLDFSANGTIPLGHGLMYRTSATASYLIKLQQTNADGSLSRYDGSLGACNITSCSGAPRWRAVWLNTLEFGNRGSISLTANYTSGFSEVATDSGGTYGNCAQSTLDGQIVAFPDGTPVQCNERSTFYLDGHVEIKAHDQFTFYLDVRNILDRHADYTPNAAYGIYEFNPAWQDSLFIGRYFRAGVRVDF